MVFMKNWDGLINGTSPTNLLEFKFGSNEERVHEAQKSLALIEFLIRLTTRDEQTVLDPFMGSGTTALAAKNMKLHFIGFEVNEDYHLKALKRIQEASKVVSLF